MESTFSEINITPFTDVLLVLLVIFMILAALVVPPGFERQLNGGCDNCLVHPPKAATAIVTVAGNGAIFVNGRRTTEHGLYGMLAAIGAHNRRTRVQVVADVKARYGIIIRVLDAAKLSGLSDVQFVTE